MQWVKLDEELEQAQLARGDLPPFSKEWYGMKNALSCDRPFSVVRKP
jgi:hypothetical protein